MLKNVEVVKVNNVDNCVIIKVNEQYFCIEFDKGLSIVDIVMKLMKDFWRCNERR